MLLLNEMPAKFLLIKMFNKWNFPHQKLLSSFCSFMLMQVTARNDRAVSVIKLRMLWNKLIGQILLLHEHRSHKAFYNSWQIMAARIGSEFKVKGKTWYQWTVGWLNVLWCVIYIFLSSYDQKNLFLNFFSFDFAGETEHFKNAFAGNDASIMGLPLAFYSGMYAYSGW